MLSWPFFWILFTALLFMMPVGYGWGYRQWGPPYPRYIQRRRGMHAAIVTGAPAFNHEAWGWRGDIVWGVFLVAVFAACMGIWMR